MKQILSWTLGAFCLSLFLGTPKAEFGNLQPVELVQVTSCQGSIHIRTDTGLYAQGANLEDALRNLYAGAPGDVYLETADYLLITPATERYLPRLREILRPGTELAEVESMVDAQSAAAYLHAHSPRLTLRQTWREERIPQLKIRGEHYALE